MNKPIKTVVNGTKVDDYKTDSKKGLVLIDFYADWCGPCKILGPALERLSEEMTFLLVKINTDQNQDEAIKHQVQGIPTVLFMKDGKIVDRFVGVRSPDAIRDMVKKWQ
ncbi:MAG: thioredoxin [Candidatus Altiarchaeota archaeon]|nr:thioredoxin [Candidatus Altiarchaeota archaeon]